MSGMNTQLLEWIVHMVVVQLDFRSSKSTEAAESYVVIELTRTAEFGVEASSTSGLILGLVF